MILGGEKGPVHESKKKYSSTLGLENGAGGKKLAVAAQTEYSSRFSWKNPGKSSKRGSSSNLGCRKGRRRLAGCIYSWGSQKKRRRGGGREMHQGIEKKGGLSLLSRFRSLSQTGTTRKKKKPLKGSIGRSKGAQEEEEEGMRGEEGRKNEERGGGAITAVHAGTRKSETAVVAGDECRSSPQQRMTDERKGGQNSAKRLSGEWSRLKRGLAHSYLYGERKKKREREGLEKKSRSATGLTEERKRFLYRGLPWPARR